jgi:large-conductance mechanosensitive channel
MSQLATRVAAAAAEADSGGRTIEWPTVILILGLLLIAFLVFVSILSTQHETKKLHIDTAQQEALRSLVDRYEQLASSTLDAQQRTAADVAELRARAASIEQILRSVD